MSWNFENTLTKCVVFKLYNIILCKVKYTVCTFICKI